MRAGGDVGPTVGDVLADHPALQTARSLIPVRIWFEESDLDPLAWWNYIETDTGCLDDSFLPGRISCH